MDKAHGRVETRRIWTSTKLQGYLEFAHAAQAGPERLLALNRGHWSIENRLHHVRDMAYDEDRCRARKGNAPRTLACVRNFAISVLRLHKTPNIKAAMRDLAARPATILAMLHL